MAIVPLFVASMATLKERLRLSGVPSTAIDTLSIVDQCVQNARLKIYRRLSPLRINQILAIPYVENPTDADGVTRALANSVELDLVLIELFKRLPSAWMDASGDLNKRWNEEAPFRERGKTDLAKFILALENSLEQDFELLGLEEDFDDESGIKGFTIEPLTTSPRPGDSLLTPARTFIDFPEDP